MSALRNCPACGRKFLEGKRALVPGQLGKLARKLVCRRCAAGAERIIVAASNVACSVVGCQTAASVCGDHHREQLAQMRELALAAAVAAIRSYLAAHLRTEPAKEASEYAEGFRSGIAAALATLERPEP